MHQEQSITQDLINIGFTPSEARTYLKLIELGESKTGRLCDELRIPSSHIYRILDGLIKKGVVSYKVANNIKIFKANNPDTLNQLYVERKEALEKQRTQISHAISNLKQLPKIKETTSDYKYFEGISGIRAMWLEINELLEPNTQVHIYISTVESWEQFNAFYLEHHSIRKEKNVHLQMIIPTGLTKHISTVKQIAKEREAIGNIEIRFIEDNNQAEFGIYNGNVMIQDTSKATKNPRSFLIKDNIFAQTFTNIFEKLWKQAEKKIKK